MPDRPLKLSPYSRTGMIHGAYAAAYPAAYPIASRAFRYPELAGSWQYRRGFAHAALTARGAR